MESTIKGNKLKRNFYKKDLLVVAKELLGKVLVKNNNGKFISGRIVEVEAYDGDIDRAAHSYGGKTKRNEVMFNEGGLLYVYLSYGVHYCSNVVTGVAGKGTAVLIRAVEPVIGVEEMMKNRFGNTKLNEKKKINLTNGPGKICQAFGINKSHSGTDLTSDKIFLVNYRLRKNEKVGVSRRIGITKSVELPWRFYIKDNPYLSRK